MTVDGHGAHVAADVNNPALRGEGVGSSIANVGFLSGSIRGRPLYSRLMEGKIIFRFHARDLHLVLGPGTQGRPIRYRVTIDARLQGRLTVSIPMHKARES
jgi:hypothetical protein